MKKYIDCDGVLLNTEELLYRDYNIARRTNPNLSMKDYLYTINWDALLDEAKPINNSLSILKQYPTEDVMILTKVFTLKEGDSKIRYFRKHQVENNIILVPNYLEKSEVVEAKGNILVDDSIKNLQDWDNHEGYSIYFGEGQSHFQNVTSIDDVLDLKKVKRLIR